MSAPRSLGDLEKNSAKNESPDDKQKQVQIIWNQAPWRNSSFGEEFHRLDFKIPGLSSDDGVTISLVEEAKEDNPPLIRGEHYTQGDERITIVSFHDNPMYRKLLAIQSELSKLFGMPFPLLVPLYFKSKFGLSKALMPFEINANATKIYPFTLPNEPVDSLNNGSSYIFSNRAFNSEERLKFRYLMKLYMSGYFDMTPQCAEERICFLVQNSSSRVKFMNALIRDARAQIADYFEMVLTCRKEGREFDASRWIALEKAKERGDIEEFDEESDEELDEESDEEVVAESKEEAQMVVAAISVTSEVPSAAASVSEAKTDKSDMTLKIMKDFSRKYKRSRSSSSSEEKSEVSSLASVSEVKAEKAVVPPDAKASKSEEAAAAPDASISEPGKRRRTQEASSVRGSFAPVIDRPILQHSSSSLEVSSEVQSAESLSLDLSVLSLPQQSSSRSAEEESFAASQVQATFFNSSKRKRVQDKEPALEAQSSAEIGALPQQRSSRSYF